MRWFRYILFMAALISSVAVMGQYNPTNPPEPGSYYTLMLKTTPEGSGSFNINTVTSYTEGTYVRLRAYANTNFVFKGWEQDGELISTDIQFDYKMPRKSVTVTAHFEYDPSNPGEPQEPNIPVYRAIYVSVTPTGGGSYNITNGNKYEVGTSVNLKAYNNTNFAFKDWTEDGEVISTSSTFNYVVKDRDSRLVANFIYSPSNPAEPTEAKLSHKLYLRTNPANAGSFNISSGNSYQEGTAIGLRAYANQYYTFENWTLEGEVISSNYDFSYVMPTHDVTLTANYSYNYNPNNPYEPGAADTHSAVYGMTETVFRGQKVLYPIYLENTSINARGFKVDVQFPEGFTVDTENIVLSGRGTDHKLTVNALGGNNYRISVLGDEPLIDTNGKVIDIPVSIPMEAQMDMTYPVVLTHGVIIGVDNSQTPVSVRDGGLLVQRETESGLYARFSFDKFQNRVKFNNQSSDKAISYLWEFGDGTQSTETSPFHIYAKSGVYTARLTAYGDSNTDIAEMSVLINEEANWTAQGTYYLASENSGVRYFTSVEEFFKMLNHSKITGDLRLVVESGQTFDYALNTEHLSSINMLTTALNNGDYTLTFEKQGSNRNPVIMFGDNMAGYDALTTNRVFELGKRLMASGVEFRVYGALLDFGKMNETQSQEVNSGVKTKPVEFSLISPDLKFKWSIANPPSPKVTGYLSSGERTITSMALVNEELGDYPLTYNVVATYQDKEFYRFDYIIYVKGALVGLFNNFTPLNNAMLDHTQVTLTWDNILNAEYDVYLWNAKNEMPQIPVAENIKEMRFVSTNFCSYGNTYKWLVKAHNEVQEIVSDTLTFTVQSLPDLHIVSLDCSQPTAEKKFTVKWTVRNDGRGPTGSVQWTDYIWLIQDVYGGTGTTGSQLIKSVPNVKALDPGESYESSVDLTLPERIYGNYYILVTTDMYNVTDINWSSIGGNVIDPYTPAQDGSSYKHLFGATTASYNKLDEEGETKTYSDNFFYKKFEIGVPDLADLQVTSVLASIIPGKNIVLGAAYAAGTIPPPFDDTLITLGYTAGDIALIQEDYTPTPVSACGLRLSDGWFSGKLVRVDVTVENKGGAPTVHPFRTVLYMSHSADHESDDLVAISSETCSTSFSSDKRLVITYLFYLPYEWSGHTYFHAYADIDDSVYELANTQNNWGVSGKYDVMPLPSADLKASVFNTPKTASFGTPIDYSYMVHNIGPNVPFKSNWEDRVYISKKNTGLDESARQVAKIYRHGRFTYTIVGNPGGTVLVKPEEYSYEGDSYAQTGTITLKDVDAGKYYLYLVVDAANDILEINGEGNNVICSGPITIYKPDLTTELLSMSADTIRSSETLALRWKLKNVGTGDIQNVKIKDAFYASVNQDGTDAVKVGEMENVVSIASGSEKTLRANVIIPRTSSLDGLRYVFVRTNINNGIEEVTTDNNMSGLSKLTFEYLEEGQQPKVDGTNLVLKEIEIPNVCKPGAMLDFALIAQNQGSIAINENVSVEAFLSDTYNFEASQAVKCDIAALQGTTEGLKSGSSVRITGKVTIPGNIQGGDKYLHIFLDRANKLKEKNPTDNHSYLGLRLNGNLADLELTNVEVPDTIMSSVATPIRWRLANRGEWKAPSFKVSVYLSQDAKWDYGDQRIAIVDVSSLEIGQEVSQSARINIPDKQNGKWYIIIKADSDRQVKDLDSSNNMSALPTFVDLSPLPDFAIGALSVDGNVVAGQKINIQSSTINLGQHATRQDKWSDVYYLSESTILDVNKAYKLGSKTHVGNLNVGDSYTNNVSFTVPSTMIGSYMLFVVADAGDAIVEVNEDNNLKNIPVYINNQSAQPADLAISKISAPGTIKAGEDVTLRYTISNVGEFDGKGELRDVIYLSTDNVWDMDDIMVGVVTGNVNIAPGASIERTVTGRITNVTEGKYYVIIRTNSTHTIGEMNEDNNIAVQRSPSHVVFNSLSLGGSTSIKTAGYYKLSVPAGSEGKTLCFDLTHPAKAQAGLYVSYGRVPSTAKYDNSSATLDVTRQQVLMPDVKQGEYYILAQDNATIVNGESMRFYLGSAPQASTTNMNLSAREVKFGATSLSITQGGTGGWITADLKGAMLDSIMDFRLKMGSTVIPAESVMFKDQTQSKVTFNLNQAEVGTYDIISELPDGKRASLPNGFQVVPGTSVGLGIKLDAPSQIRVDQYAPISVSYANAGTTDISIYEILLVADNAYLSMSYSGLEKHEYVIHFRPDYGTDNRGYILIPPGEQRTFNAFIQSANTLSPTVTVYIVK